MRILVSFYRFVGKNVSKIYWAIYNKNEIILRNLTDTEMQQVPIFIILLMFKTCFGSTDLLIQSEGSVKDWRFSECLRMIIGTSENPGKLNLSIARNYQFRCKIKVAIL